MALTQAEIDKIAYAVVAYKNTRLDDRDVYQILRDIDAKLDALGKA